MRPNTLSSLFILSLLLLPPNNAFSFPISLHLSKKLDTNSKLKVQVEKLNEAVTNAMAKARDSLNNTEDYSDRTREITIPMCIKLYGSALVSIAKVNKTLLSPNNLDGLAAHFKAIRSSATVCEDGFDRIASYSGLKEDNIAIQRICDNCKGIIDKQYDVIAFTNAEHTDSAPISPSASPSVLPSEQSDSPSPSPSPGLLGSVSGLLSAPSKEKKRLLRDKVFAASSGGYSDAAHHQEPESTG